MRTSTPNMWHSIVLFAAVLVLMGNSTPARGQGGCTVPSLPAVAHATNIFSEQQEEYLGDAVAEYMARNYRISSDPQLTAYLQQIGTRLFKHMPATQLHVRYFLVDLSEANAFNLAGGRVYVSPKVVALTRNEDELAGVLAHEFGHLVTHQGAVDMTRSMAEILDVTQVSDRRDVFEKFHRLIEAQWRNRGKSRHSSKESEEEQRVADRLAVSAMAGSGYSADAFANFFDRLTGTEGKTGNWLSDILGGTAPDAKRLREIIKAAAAIPEGCVDRTPKAGEHAFTTWQAAVIDYSRWNSQEVLHAVLNKTKLNPPLRGGIAHLKFSGDGRYVLAQDEGNIFVLSRQPFSPLFQIDAPDAAPAQFTPGSDQVVFHNRSLRVETWNIAKQKRVSAHELIQREGCLQSNLSPDGRMLACFEGPDLVLLDVVKGEEVLRKASFFPDWDLAHVFVLFGNLLNPESKPAFDSGFIHAEFTPDGKYLLAGHGVTHALIDLNTRQEIRIPGPLNKRLTAGFAFLGSDRVIAVNWSNPAKSQILKFPSGDTVVADVGVGARNIAAATRGDFAILRPVKDYPVGVVDLAANKPLFAYKSPALDIFDQTSVVEERDGELGLHDISTRKELGRAPLAWGHLGTLRAAAMSPDWKWLAVSEERRAAVWDLNSGDRFYHVRGFHGVYIPNDYVLYADFPKFQDTPRAFSQLSLTSPMWSQKGAIEDEHASQYGEFLVVTKIPDKSDPSGLGPHTTLEIRDVTSGATLWSREFPKAAPSYSLDAIEKRMALWWPAANPQAKEEIHSFPAVAEKLSSRKEQSECYLLEVLDARTGKAVGALAIETGKERRMEIFPQIQITLGPNLAAHSSGDWVAVAAGENHVLVYSLSTGNEVGRYFGHHPVLSAAGGLLSLENEPGHLTLYDLNSGQELDRWVFTNPISLDEFSSDGKRLFVLTSDQVAYTLGVSPMGREP